MLSTTDGLVIRVTDREDNDKLLTVLTPDRGQITVIAKGARSVHSKLLPLVQPFTYANFEIYEKGSSLGWLRGGSVIEPFYGVRDDLDHLALASYLAEVGCDITGEGEPAVDILRLLLNSLFALSGGIKPPWIVKGTFELRAAGFSGFMPDFSGCDACGCQISDPMYLDVMNGRLLCSECVRTAGRVKRTEMEMEDAGELSLLLPMSSSVTAACRYILTARPERMYAFSLDESERENFARVCEDYLLHHLERGFDSLIFYKSLDPQSMLKQTLPKQTDNT
jgi:DNA repair protein RecO (recombination protein O)